MLALRMSLARVVDDAERYLADRGVASPRVDAELLLQHVLGLERAGLYTRREALGEAEAARFAEALARRGEGTPLQHLTGEQPFFGLTLTVRPGVFVPRPETETLVERCLEVLEAVEAPRVADVGTGTGAVALALRSRRSDAAVFATDASPEAVALAGENARLSRLEIEVLEGDLLSPLPSSLRGGLDLVVSNPPYLDPEELAAAPREVRADPPRALLGGTDVHRRLAREAAEWLRPGGWLAMEIGAGQGREVAALLSGYRDVEVARDLAGLDRVVRGRWGG
jgi:release factor glutamine methyltransferase